MKYKITQGSPIFQELQDLLVLMNVAHLAAVAIMREVKADRYHIAPGAIAGGVSYFAFDKPPIPLLWKAYKRLPGLYRPKDIKANRDLNRRIGELPTVKDRELASIVKLRMQLLPSPEGLRVLIIPGMRWGRDFILMELPDDADYKPLRGMTEITVAEFKTLEAKIKPDWYHPEKQEHESGH